jgi:hypothetical protein
MKEIYRSRVYTNKPALLRAVRIVLGIVGSVSLLAMFGTAGALDNDAITVGQAVTRCLIGLAVLAGAVGGIRLTEVIE